MAQRTNTCVVQVWLDEEEIAERNRRPPFIIFEAPFTDFEQYLIAVDTDRLISGDMLLTNWGERRDERVIRQRVPYAFRGDAVRRTCLPTWRIVEEEADGS